MSLVLTNTRSPRFISPGAGHSHSLNSNNASARQLVSVLGSDSFNPFYSVDGRLLYSDSGALPRSK